MKKNLRLISLSRISAANKRSALPSWVGTPGSTYQAEEGRCRERGTNLHLRGGEKTPGARVLGSVPPCT